MKKLYSARKSLQQYKQDKAAGADELVPRFLSKIKYQLARPLTILFNNMKYGQVPADWKEANVVPVFKGGDVGMLLVIIDQLV